MKIKILLAFCACILSILNGGAQTLTDNFTGTSINTSLWNIYNTDVGNSSVTENNGATFINGAGLMTVQGFSDPTISGSFEFAGDNDDRFSIIIGFDGTSFDPHWQDPSSGIQIQFAPTSNPSPDNPSLQINDPPNPASASFLAYANPQINMDTFYNFQITDSSGLISVYMNGSTTPLLSVIDNNSYGSEIGIFNRSQIDLGGPEHETELQYISITSVPEPSGISFFELAGLAVYLIKNRKLA